MSEASLINTSTLTYPGIPITISALTLIALKALPTVIQVRLKQIILVLALNLCLLSIQR
jgi:hypothetical protein